MFASDDDGFMARRQKRREPEQASLKLTSMIDMFTILLVFLLKSFSASGDIMTVSPDLKLPDSTAKKDPIAASVIAVTEEWILLDGKRVATLEEVYADPSLRIPNLAAALRDLRAVSEGVGELSTDMGFTGKISIQGDKEIPYKVLRKVMATCGQVGYNDMMLAVNKIE
ncbi:biopolymer transporter ExbD [candidate division KSB1 bacterium]|nr:biopolymer transporter ExbD [candidate division KSB1 bacterium]